MAVMLGDYELPAWRIDGELWFKKEDIQAWFTNYADRCNVAGCEGEEHFFTVANVLESMAHYLNNTPKPAKADG